MISLQTILVLSIGITQAAAQTDGPEPPCELCDYYNGIGYLENSNFCGAYYVCIRNPDESDSYKSFTLCCPENMTFDLEHQTCKIDESCLGSSEICPKVENATYVPCPYSPDSADATKYLVNVGDKDEAMQCPYGQVWDQYLCTCARSDVELSAPCPKILSYEFSDSYDSYSCYNFASGVPYGNPELSNNMICLNGQDQFLTIPFLNNWFAWNPIGKTFTLCFWLLSEHNQTAGVLSTNCYYEEEGSVADFYLEDGQLVAQLGSDVLYLGVYPPYEGFSKVCVTFDNGNYAVFYNGSRIAESIQDEQPVNSHSATTLGFVDGKDPFYGYFDDFSFYTSVLSDAELEACFLEGRSV